MNIDTRHLFPEKDINLKTFAPHCAALFSLVWVLLSHPWFIQITLI
jgi:hypothetical protein